MSRIRFGTKTRVAEFVKDDEYVSVLQHNGIFTLEGFLQTPLDKILRTPELLANYDKFTQMFFRIYMLVHYGNFTL